MPNTSSIASFVALSFRTAVVALVVGLCLSPAAAQKIEVDLPAPSLQLTASDGTGLDLVAIDARGVLEGPLAFTELRLTFQNPRPEVIEGRFQIQLPVGAVISRFAMKIDSTWQEGEVVERQRARRIYEDFLHRRQDPALLEQETANQFSARVFPIPAHGTKDLVISYSHALTRAEDPYVIPLRGLSQIDRLDVRVLVGSRTNDETVSNLGGRMSEQRHFELHKTDWVPDRDVEVRQDPATRHGLRHANLVALRLEPQLPETGTTVDIEGLAVLVDTSASRALDLPAQILRLSALLASLDRKTPLTVAAFDQQVEPIYEGPVGGFGISQLEAIDRRGALGASDLVGALRWLAEQGTVQPRLLVLSDGVATAGDPDAESPTAHLADARKALGRAGVRRIDALAFGGLRDEAVLRRMVTTGGDRPANSSPVDGQVIDGGAGLEETLRRLRTPCVSGLEVVVDGAEWVWPQILDGIQPGDQILVYADLRAGLPVRVRVDGRPVDFAGVDGRGRGTEPVLNAAERPLLHRAWVQARMDRLLHLRATTFADDPDMRRAIATEVTQLSVEHRVLSPFTAFLVLETEDDYERYDLDRRGLADILIVGPGGIEVLDRSPEDPSSEPPMPDKPPTPRPVLASSRTTGDLVGTVTEPEGAAIPGVTLLLTARDGTERWQVSNAEGYYRFVNLQPGDYRMVARLEGFASFENPRVAVFANQTRTLDIQMSLAAVEETIAITVTSESPSYIEDGLVMEDYRSLDSLGYLDGDGADRAEIFMPGDAEVDGMVLESPASPEPIAPPDSSVASRAADPIPPPPSPLHAGRDAGPHEAQDEVAAPDEETPHREPPHTGRFAEIVERLHQGELERAAREAEAWLAQEPGDVLALVALGAACEASGDLPRAARAYGSLIDLFPSRADLRRYAGERLDRLASHHDDAHARDLAIDTYRRALQQRPDHPSSHRQLAWALLAAGRAPDAFGVIEAALGRVYAADRFEGVERILRDDLGLLAAAWLADDESAAVDVRARLRAVNAVVADAPSLRFVLTWETDANDVDLHLWDAQGGHASYQSTRLPSGGELFADVTDGYGPECFAIPDRAQAAPYRMQAHYYNRGAMGFGLGTLDVVEHDGAGGLRVDHRPFVIMVDDGWVDLGTWPAEASED